MSTEANKALIRRLVREVVNGGNLDLIDELAIPGFVEHSPPPGGSTSKAGIRQAIEMNRTAFPDLHSTEEDLIAEGDRVVYRGTLRGTHTGPLMGLPPTGKPMAIAEIHIIRFEEGRMAEHWAQFDLLGLFQQLGIGPGAGGH